MRLQQSRSRFWDLVGSVSFTPRFDFRLFQNNRPIVDIDQPCLIPRRAVFTEEFGGVTSASLHIIVIAPRWPIILVADIVARTDIAGQHIKNETAEPGDGLAVSHL